jgi:hypothetical protein
MMTIMLEEGLLWRHGELLFCGLGGDEVSKHSITYTYTIERPAVVVHNWLHKQHEKHTSFRSFNSSSSVTMAVGRVTCSSLADVVWAVTST